jgi:S-methylmethionine-dependent homocysteine/selenocysteine methylase
MTKYRTKLPQLDGGLFLTDGGLETTLVFHQGYELPHFAAFDLMRTTDGKETLRRYYARYAAIARDSGLGFILEAPTWRANADWGERLGYTAEALAAVNEESIELMREVRDAFEDARTPMVISGCIGPRGDGYDPGMAMSTDAAEAYHARQVRTFRATAADMVTAITMTNVNEALGITRAAVAEAMPVAISFTLETDGRLPTGQDLQEAIETIDAATGAAPVYYMINCAHPEHFESTLAAGGDWIGRLRGIRANASRRSHAELDAAPELDDGDPIELGRQYRALLARHPHLTVLGGCCGTDHRHIEAICRACTEPAA